MLGAVRRKAVLLVAGMDRVQRVFDMLGFPTALRASFLSCGFSVSSRLANQSLSSCSIATLIVKSCDLRNLVIEVIIL